MVETDSLSRLAFNSKNDMFKLSNESMEKIKELHKKLGHRKTIFKNIIEEGINASQKEIREILRDCEVCAKKDKKIGKKARLIRVDKPGELMGADMLDIGKEEKIIVMIDYFTRKVFANMVNSKEANKVLKFIKEVYEEFPFKNLRMDNGREFANKNMLQ